MSLGFGFQSGTGRREQSGEVRVTGTSYRPPVTTRTKSGPTERGSQGLHLKRRSSTSERLPLRRSSREQERRSRLDFQPTLRQAWPQDCPRPQYAFKMSMFNVSCNSH